MFFSRRRRRSSGPASTVGEETDPEDVFDAASVTTSRRDSHATASTEWSAAATATDVPTADDTTGSGVGDGGIASRKQSVLSYLASLLSSRGYTGDAPTLDSRLSVEEEAALRAQTTIVRESSERPHFYVTARRGVKADPLRMLTDEERKSMLERCGFEGLTRRDRGLPEIETTTGTETDSLASGSGKKAICNCRWQQHTDQCKQKNGHLDAPSGSGNDTDVETGTGNATTVYLDATRKPVSELSAGEMAGELYECADLIASEDEWTGNAHPIREAKTLRRLAELIERGDDIDLARYADKDFERAFSARFEEASVPALHAYSRAHDFVEAATRASEKSAAQTRASKAEERKLRESTHASDARKKKRDTLTRFHARTRNEQGNIIVGGT